MNKNNYITLLFKKLKGDISLEEQSMLDVWKSQAVENEQLVNQVEKDWQLTEQYTAPSEESLNIDLAADFSRLQKRIEQDEDLIKTTPDNLSVAHQPIGKIVELNTKKSASRWIGWAAAAVVALAVGFWFTSQSTTTTTTEMLVATTQYKEQKTVRLADGTQVWLNSSSELSYPSTFTEDTRTVQLTGEAFFEVTKNPTQPFIINTNKAKVTVLGTSFNVRTRIAENNTEVIVKTGKVRLENEAGDKKIELLPNQKGVYNRSTNTIAEMEGQDMNELAWQSGRILFDNTPLKEVIEDLAKLFEVEIELKDTNLSNCPYSGLERTEDGISAILESVANEFKMQVKRLGNTSFELLGGSCKE